ncbi:protein GL2-INTERACTING REPRESSOR 1-like [Andrographis paniculata]|uniref:protein GL2-INTERACTING REPRESSOR 1-like n=1 Tax=Andrographis paniculata TaxID=175694 RepID=UPI0021E8EC52|nr:protein GL2-INTERACTING REPRESSOR 1-like [Andrographis paniculata]
MSRRSGGSKPELKLNVTPAAQQGESPSPSPSPTRSCVSSEGESSPEATSMMLVGCPRCLMYVMLSEQDPRCPKCKSTVLLDVVHQQNNPNPNPAAKKRNSQLWEWSLNSAAAASMDL